MFQRKLTANKINAHNILNFSIRIYKIHIVVVGDCIIACAILEKNAAFRAQIRWPLGLQLQWKYSNVNHKRVE